MQVESSLAVQFKSQTLTQMSYDSNLYIYLLIGPVFTLDTKFVCFVNKLVKGKPFLVMIFLPTLIFSCVTKLQRFCHVDLEAYNFIFVRQNNPLIP